MLVARNCREQAITLKMPDADDERNGNVTPTVATCERGTRPIIRF